ncbi:MAG: alpha/beta hydrolase [Myxococcales bacterium]|nr:alpha/beta hydrolase [Myxococcales bacterium]
MKHSLAICIVLAASLGIAHADDPMPAEETSTASEAPAPAPVAEPAPAESPDKPADNGAQKPNDKAPEKPNEKPVPGPRARLSNPTPRTIRPRIKDDGESRLDKQEDTVAGGRHFRIKTAQGAVHVWFPENYDRETAGTVVYVHGYWTDADGAWRDYGLARQFRASKQNAMFVVPDAPSNNDESVQWPALSDLRRAVSRANIKIPDGPVVVMGHSGAFRTVMQWVDNRVVDQIILLDALYAGESAFDEFIKSGKRAEDHKLIVVAANTAQESKAFATKYKFAVAREKMPDSVGGFTKRERGAKLLYVRSQYEHMQIVTSRKVIPMLLRVTPLKAL